MKLDAAQTDRAIGSLVAAAAGDALGAGYEFGSAPLDGEPDMIGGGLGNFAKGEWTDDTAQTYAIAEVAATGADLRDDTALDQIARRFADWYADSPPDVGILTRQVLAMAGRSPSGAQMRGAADQAHQSLGRSGGNGALMRTAAVALAHLDDPGAIVEAAMKVSALTHHDPIAGEASAIWCLAINHAVLTGELPDLAGLLVQLPPERHGFWAGIIAEAQSREPESFNANGYVVTALQAAWSAIVHTPVPADEPGDGSFPCAHLVDSLGTAIGIGHDTDTVASIAGALLGARWGVSALPWRWRRILHGWPGGTAKSLADLALLTVGGGEPDRQGWPTGDRIDYSQWPGHDTYEVHPLDPGVWLAGADVLDHLPEDVTTVVSLTRVGRRQVPDRVVHAEFRIIDTNDADNPNLAHAIDDAAHAVLRLREEGHTVLLHCAAAQSRTPSVAARYGVLLGHPVEDALSRVVEDLPQASPRPALAAAVRRLGGLEDPLPRPVCPSCGSRNTEQRIWGMPTPALDAFARTVDWIRLEGCVVLGGAWEVRCRDCGAEQAQPRGDAEGADISGG